MNITQMINEGSLDAEKMMPVLMEYMDIDIMEQLHAQLAPCTDQDFVLAYCDAHREKYGEDFYI